MNSRLFSTVFHLSILLLPYFISTGCGDKSLPTHYDGEGNLLQPLEQPIKKLNILLISIDTLRADHLRCYGYPRPISPNIDSLARKGILFQNALSASPWTTPSHISLMTSLYPSVHKIFSYPFPGSLDPKVVTLAEVLQKQGFRTAGFTEGGYMKGSTGLNHGFDLYPAWPGDQESYYSHELYPSRLEENTKHALAWLEQNSKERFFLFFHTYEPHFEYRPPQKYLSAVAPHLSVAEEERSLRKAVLQWNNGSELSPIEKGNLYRHFLQGDLEKFRVKKWREFVRMIRAFSRQEWTYSPGFREDLAYITDLYDAEILYTDVFVGKLLEKLEKLALLDSTLIVFTADHGEGLMDHGIVQHGENLFDELLRVPLILHFPDGFDAGKEITTMVRTIDIMPTIFDTLGLPINREAQGKSLFPLLRGKDFSVESLGEALCIQGEERSLLALRTEQWKYVRHTRNDQEELYDLNADPGERTNLSLQSLEVVKKLRKRLNSLHGKNQEIGQKYSVGKRVFSEKDQNRLEALGYVVK